MSFYFNIKSQNEVTYDDLTLGLNNPSIRFYSQPNHLSDPLKRTKIYILNKSTRGITISKEENSYSIGINVMASEEDFKLAVDISKIIAQLTNGEILPEDAENSVTSEELIANYNQEWIDSIKTLGVDLFLDSIGKDGHLLSIGCCYMNYTIGPAIHQTLDDSSEVNYYNSLVEHIQNTQFFDLNKYQIPQIIVTSKQDGSNRKRYVVFYSHGSQFLSHADYVVFPAKNGKYVLPYDQVQLIANSKFNRIDETQYTIEPLTEAEYAELLISIEAELSKIDEEALKVKYKEFTKDELDDEFDRLTLIPDARLKIFALQRMSILISEYEERNIPMPNSQQKTEHTKEIQANQNKQSNESNKKGNPTQLSQPKKTIQRKKPWWKFW